MPNRLAQESSPYLRQHANNPVDWYPWGDEAFTAAREADKPLFVSIGYATCHWCHVMERESFEDPGIAALMNDAFVNVKVDREERPDVDGIYMTVCQMVTGHGGWPLNVVLTPDRRPVFAGTYIPPSSMHGRMGMRELVPRLKQIWGHQRDRMEKSAEEITSLLQREAQGDLRADVGGLSSLNEAATHLRQQYDTRHAGFGGAPKFPMPHYIGLLLRHWHLSGDEQSLEMATSTLKAMARGGIHDHIGFGFHRYSTDAEWLVPHFEKMLYDQATLLDAYVDGYLASGQTELAEVAESIAEYVIRDLRSADGAFYSAEDADSEGIEGKFYVWTIDELTETLEAEDAVRAIDVYNATKEGNFRDEATGQRTGTNILHLSPTEGQLARDAGREAVRSRLLAERERRERPLLDDKILTDWNGLMIAAMARAGSVLDDGRLIEVAAQAAEFLFDHMVEDGGRVLHRLHGRQSGIPGNLDDYAFLARACLELYLATSDGHWMEKSAALVEQSLDRFWDDERGGFYFAPAGREDLIVRRKEIQDGATPSGLSVSVLNLARVGRLLRRDDLLERARLAVKSVGESIDRYPSAHTALVSHLGHLEPGAGETVIVGSKEDPATREMLAAALGQFSPYRLTVHIDPNDGANPLLKVAPHFAAYSSIDGKATAYVCRDFVCEAPTTDPASFRTQIEGEDLRKG
jgi:uncharacterized protein YyaL (SSP411 family)